MPPPPQPQSQRHPAADPHQAAGQLVLAAIAGDKAYLLEAFQERISERDADFATVGRLLQQLS